MTIQNIEIIPKSIRLLKIKSKCNMQTMFTNLIIILSKFNLLRQMELTAAKRIFSILFVIYFISVRNIFL